jgi:NCAIR mutase (PurE)-related protein
VRQGTPEVIFGEGKTPQQIAGIARELGRKGQNVLVTRLAPEPARLVAELVPELTYAPLSRTAFWEQAPIPLLEASPVALVTAGTSDLPVAEECAETMHALGVPFARIVDVGVAGLHRLLYKREALSQAPLVVVVAGMEGALASVVGGLVDAPVIAVPTSVGYGAARGGMTALFAMLTSCASGVTVVNIDNGFGAAFAAFRFLRQMTRMRAATVAVKDGG